MAALGLVALAYLAIGLHWGFSAQTQSASNASLTLVCAGPVLLVLAVTVAWLAAGS